MLMNEQFQELVHLIRNLVYKYKITDISINSREIHAHSIFAALKGAKVDGRDFIPQVAAQGCKVVLTSNTEQYAGKIYQHQLTQVSNGEQNYEVDVIEIYELEKYLSFIALKIFEELAIVYQNATKQPITGLNVPVIGITGTNGKTLTTNLICQALSLLKPESPVYYSGTIGYGDFKKLTKAINTTPDAASVMRLEFQAQLAKASAFVLEVSSHGLALNRVRNLRFEQAIFTNLTQDHLDFHNDMESYYLAKEDLFSNHNVRDYIITVNGKDDEYGNRLVKHVSRKLCISDEGHEHARGIPAYQASMMSLQGAIPSKSHLAGAENTRPNPLGQEHIEIPRPYLNDIESQIWLKEKASRLAVININQTPSQAINCKADVVVELKSYQANPQGLFVTFTLLDKANNIRQDYQFTSSLMGIFNVYNLLNTFTSLYLYGYSAEQIIAVIPHLTAVNGRMHKVGNSSKTIIVDFAHTPDALEKLLQSIKQHFTTTDHKTWLLFGCGGDRDPGKRPLMGAIAEKYADHIIITDDNPRSEDPTAIAQQIEAGITNAEAKEQVTYISDRKAAIEYALQHAQEQDLIVIAGKGHESEQVYKDKVLHFNDVEVVESLLQKSND